MAELKGPATEEPMATTTIWRTMPMTLLPRLPSMTREADLAISRRSLVRGSPAGSVTSGVADISCSGVPAMATGMASGCFSTESFAIRDYLHFRGQTPSPRGHGTRKGCHYYTTLGTRLIVCSSDRA